MKINILTLFPEMFTGILENSIIKRAISKKIVEIKLINIRDFTKDKHHRVDSAPIGGGPGLIMMCQPIMDALKSTNLNAKKILLSPLGETYNQEMAVELSKEKEITLIAGHYEGVDFRVNKYMDKLVSIGDYILTGGEIPIMAIVDSIIRLLDGSINKDSLNNESFNNNLLEYPQYTKPNDFNGDKVPDILYCGNHEIINEYNYKQQLILTKKYRPDLFKKIKLSDKDKKILNNKNNGKLNLKEKKAVNKGKKYLPK